jgi:hypothetical protein
MTSLLSSREAMRRLNVSRRTFVRLVESRKIRKELSPNKRQLLYREEDVQRIEQDIQSFLDMYLLASENDQIIFTPVENEDDLEATVHIGRQHFGDFTYSLETRLHWFRISPKGDAVLKHDGVVVGYFSMQAIKKEAVERIFEHKSGEVQTEDMLPIQGGKTMGERLECYISAIAVTTVGIKRAQSRTYGMLLLMGIAERLVELGKEGIAMSKIWAKSRTVSGIKLCRDLGFTELGYIDDEQIGFVLDVGKSDLPAIRRYGEALGNWYWRAYK